jgi:hypothetical protein
MESLVIGHTFVTVENCEDAWNESVDGDVTATASNTTGMVMVGTYSCKLVMGSGIDAGDILATEAMGALDISGCDYLAAWIYSTVDLAAGDIQILLDEDAVCASPSESLDVTAVTADTWTRVALPMAAAGSTRNAIISVGVKMVTALGAFTLYLDDIQAFDGRVYGVLGIRGLNDPDDVELNAAGVVKLLNGSYYANDVPSYNRNITVSFGPLLNKADRVFLLTTWMKATIRLIAQGDEATVCRTTERFGNEWLEGLNFAKSFTMSFVEKTARTVDPYSFDVDSLSISYSGDSMVTLGVRYFSGSGAPASDLGNDGDWYFDTSGLIDYTKRVGVWSQR